MNAPKILLMTDTHLVRAGQTIIGIDPWARFEAALAHMTRRHPDAARLIVMGDLVHEGGAEVYARMAARLAELALPVSLTLGNHDSRSGFAAGAPCFGTDADGFMQSVHDLGNDRLILLDTLDEGLHQHWGRLCEKRLAFLEAALTGAGERRVSLFMHHPAFPIGYPGLDAMMLRQAPEFLQFCQGRVAHIFAGHVHRTISASSHGIGLTTLKGTAHQSPLLLDSWNTSISVDEPGAYGVVLFQPEAIVCHSEDFELSVLPGPDALDHAI
jgi:3',5'-cyclic AMP phosphodiesterase CpdA